MPPSKTIMIKAIASLWYLSGVPLYTQERLLVIIIDEQDYWFCYNIVLLGRRPSYSMLSTSLGAPPPKANGLFSVTFFSILYISYVIKYSFRDPVESAVRKRVVLYDRFYSDSFPFLIVPPVL